MTIILELIANIFLMIAFGYVVKKLGLLSDTLEKGLTKLLLTAILPLSVISSGNVELTPELTDGIIVTAMLTAGYYIAALIVLSLISKPLPLGKTDKKMMVIMGMFANTAFIGFPIAGAMFGEEGVLYCAVYNLGYQLLFFTWGISSIAGEGKFELKTLIKTPVTIACFLTLILVFSPIKLPNFLQETFSDIGSMTTPISLMIIGCSFTKIKLLELLKDKWSYLVAAVRLAIFPAIMLVIVLWLNLPAIPAATCVLLTALPCGSLGALYAERYNCSSEFATRAVIQTTFLMVATLPVLLIILEELFVY